MASKRIKTLQHTAWLLLVSLTVLFAILLTIARYTTPFLTKYHNVVEKIAHHIIDRPVSIGQLRASWYGVGPVLQLQDVTVYDTDKKTQVLVHIDTVSLHLSILAFIRQGAFFPNRLALQGVRLTLIKSADGLLYLPGHEDNKHAREIQLDEILKRMQSVEQIVLNQAKIDLHLADGKVQQLNAKEIMLINRGRRHQLNIQLQSARTLDGQLQLNVELFGDLHTPSDLSGKIYLKTQAWDLTELPWLIRHAEFSLDKGIADIECWLTWNNKTIKKIQTHFVLRDAQLQVQKRILKKVHVAGELAWMSRKGNNWVLFGNKILLEQDKKRFVPDQFKIVHEEEASGYSEYIFQSDLLHLAGLADVLRASPWAKSSLAGPFVALAPSGALHNVMFRLIKTAQTPYQMVLDADFTDISTQAWHDFPQMTGLDGVMHLRDQQGRVTLYTNRLTLEKKNLLSSPLEIQRFTGDIQWYPSSRGLVVVGKDLSIVAQEGRIAGHAGVVFPQQGEPTVEVIAQVAALDAKAVLQRFSKTSEKSHLVQWLKAAVVQGRLTEGLVLLRGAFKDFPYDNGAGAFEVRFKVNDGTLAYHREWPKLEHLFGDVIIHGRTLDARIHSGNIYDADIVRASIKIPKVGADKIIRLLVDGSVKGDGVDGLRFIKESPLGEHLAKGAQDLTIKGDILTNLTLDLPLWQKNGALSVDGTVEFKSSDMAIPSWGVGLNHLRGSLGFDATGIIASKLQADYWGGPIDIAIAKKQVLGHLPYTSITVQGDMTSSALAQRYPSVWWKYLSGKSRYEATFQLYHPQDTHDPSLTLTSDLSGVAVALPAPFAKTSEVARQLNVQISWLNSERKRYRIQYGDVGAGVFDTKSSGQDLIFERAAIVLGRASIPPLPEQPGLVISGQTDTLAYDAWANWFKQLPRDKKDKPFFVFNRDFHSLDLKIASLNLLHQSYPNSAVSVRRNAADWAVKIKSKAMNADIVIPEAFPNQAIAITADRCRYNSMGKAEDERLARLLPTDIMAFDLNCRQSRFNDFQLGQGALSVKPVKSGVAITKMNFTNKVFQFSGKGYWLYQDKTHTSQLSGQFRADDLARALETFGLRSDIDDARAKIVFNLKWPTQPMHIDLARAVGDFTLRIKEGRIVEISPGVGRVFSLFSLDALQRRLRLDFSDVFREGFSFDAMRGNFVLERGDAHTENTLIEGPSASIAIIGRTGLVKEDLDFTVEVSPHVSGTIPVAVALATGNPAIGAAVWAFNKVLSPNLRKIARYRYHVTGTWTSPTIKPLGAHEK